MKKLLLILVLGVFAFGSSGFGYENSFLTIEQPDCDALMQNVYAGYSNSGHSSDYSFRAAIWAYEGCVGNGGSSNTIN